MILAAALYGIGKSFFWGTSLAVVSDRFPHGGAVTINVLAGVGMLAAGIMGSVLLGTIQDRATADSIVAYDSRHGTALFEQYSAPRPASVFGSYRAIDQSALDRAPEADQMIIELIIAASKKDALRDVSFLPILTCIAFALLALGFHLKGGYARVSIMDKEEER